MRNIFEYVRISRTKIRESLKFHCFSELEAFLKYVSNVIGIKWLEAKRVTEGRMKEFEGHRTCASTSVRVFSFFSSLLPHPHSSSFRSFESRTLSSRLTFVFTSSKLKLFWVSFIFHLHRQKSSTIFICSNCEFWWVLPFSSLIRLQTFTFLLSNSCQKITKRGRSDVVLKNSSKNRKWRAK